MPPASAVLSHAFSRAQRIRKRPEFVRIQDSSARVSTRNLLLLLGARTDDKPPRLGVVASRKVGNAVVRNRCKRLVREAFRALQHEIPRNIDVVVIVRPGTHLLGAGEVEGQIRQALPQLSRRARELLSKQASR